MKRLLTSLCLTIMAVATAMADLGGFYYDNCRIEATVSKDNVWTITEMMDVMFMEPRHGIYRYIPYTFSVNQEVGVEKGNTYFEEKKFYAKVTDINANTQFETEDVEDCKMIRLGSPDEFVSGKVRYIISYQYKYPDDRNERYDYVYHTILGTGFNEEIKNFSFKITFEKPLPADAKNDINIYTGRYGEANPLDSLSNASFTIDGNTITGEAHDIAPKHGITLSFALPQGYYENPITYSPTPTMILLVISALLLLLILFYALTIRHEHINKTVVFYPPEDINSAEVGTIIDDSVDDIDLASLIPWMAGKGYVRIKEVDLGKGRKNPLCLERLVEYEEVPKDERDYITAFMKALFGDCREVRLDKMERRPNAISNVKSSIKKIYSNDKQLTRTSDKVFLYLLLMLTTYAAMCLSSTIYSFNLDDFISLSITWLLPFFGGFVMRVTMSDSDHVSSKFRKIAVFTGKMIAMAVMSMIVWDYLESEMQTSLGEETYLLMTLSCFLVTELSGRFNLDTPYRVQMMGQLLGLRDFIETAEKQSLEKLQADDPLYFFRILPYAMVFDLSDKWADQFKDIVVEIPDWYDSAATAGGALAVSSLVSNITRSTDNAMSVVGYSESSSSGGGGGGGGFSGGGGGGGGGGSW